MVGGNDDGDDGDGGGSGDSNGKMFIFVCPPRVYPLGEITQEVCLSH